jgi:8-oxo-dGTP pyrophosphatase MutT (NUDIX family)
MNLNKLSPAEISKKLDTREIKKAHNPYPSSLSESSAQPAAVLIPLLRDLGSWHILFIRRTEIAGDRHSGQVAFPGGVCDPGDGNAEEAALRETQEELGVDPQDITLLGKLDQFMTVTDFLVTPIVGMMPWPYSLLPEPREVSRVFTIPLNWLNNPSNRKVVERELPNGISTDVIYFNEYDGEVLWGASARFTLAFLNVITSN